LSSAKSPLWAELIQLLPVVSLALPFIVAGRIDLQRAQGALLIAAFLTVPVTALVLRQKAVLNPILIGTDLWLWVSALAFFLPLPRLVALLSDAQGFGLFAFVLVVGVVCTVLSPQGFTGYRDANRRRVLRTSLGLLALAACATIWSWAFRHDIRVGGGLPFIVLNVARRAIILRASRGARNRA
jgi:hypothetical protein